MYKQYGIYDENNLLIEVQKTSIQRLSDNACIPFDPANTDYQRFKSEINSGEAELQDADGNTMSAEEAKAFIKELP